MATPTNTAAPLNSRQSFDNSASQAAQESVRRAESRDAVAGKQQVKRKDTGYPVVPDSSGQQVSGNGPDGHSTGVRESAARQASRQSLKEQDPAAQGDDAGARESASRQASRKSLRDQDQTAQREETSARETASRQYSRQSLQGQDEAAQRVDQAAKDTTSRQNSRVAVKDQDQAAKETTSRQNSRVSVKDQDQATQRGEDVPLAQDNTSGGHKRGESIGSSASVPPAEKTAAANTEGGERPQVSKRESASRLATARQNSQKLNLGERSGLSVPAADSQGVARYENGETAQQDEKKDSGVTASRKDSAAALTTSGQVKDVKETVEERENSVKKDRDTEYTLNKASEKLNREESVVIRDIGQGETVTDTTEKKETVSDKRQSVKTKSSSANLNA